MARTPDLERRQELLDRIVVYLAENGLAQATLRPMAASLDVSINRLVHHFGTKEELLAAALRRSIDLQIEVQHGWMERNPQITMAEMYRKWWKWINASEANMAIVRLNYEAAALDTKVTGLAGTVRAEQIGVWRHEAQYHFEAEGLSRERAVLEASLAKATFTGLIIDLLATGERRRLNAIFEEFIERTQAALNRART
ncbi:MAG: TetR/AcrR family transcriptional regulator [Actinomycetota bacterium]